MIPAAHFFYARLPEKQRHSEYVSAICGQTSGASEGKPPYAAFGTPGCYFIKKVFKTFREAFRASLFSAFARNVERRVKSGFAVTASS